MGRRPIQVPTPRLKGRRPKPSSRRRVASRHRVSKSFLELLKSAWRVVAAGVALAASVVGLLTYFWPTGPRENQAQLSAALTPYPNLRSYRNAVFPNCVNSHNDPDCTSYAMQVLRLGPVLGLNARVENLVGFKGKPLIWRWELLRANNTPVKTDPPGGAPNEVASNKDRDAFDLQPAAIFTPVQGGTFYARVTLEASPASRLATACSKLVFVSARGAPFRTHLRGNPVGC